jgi:transcriptional regulator with XRE-family HTH domain
MLRGLSFLDARAVQDCLHPEPKPDLPARLQKRAMNTTDLSFGSFLRKRRLAISPSVVRLGSYERLRSRVGRPVTQEEVSEAVGVSRTWYALLEAGAARASAALAGRLADAFALDVPDRLGLLRMALPDIGLPSSSTVDLTANLEILTLGAAPSAGLSIATPAEIEQTAQDLMRIRERFLATGELAPGSRARIVTSWLRSRAAAVDASRAIAPLLITRDAELDDLRLASERLSYAARPVITFLVDHLAGSGYVVVLTDHAGQILSIEGDTAIVRLLERLEFVPGADWSEVAAGTNAIGTALADGRPLQLMAAEHFCEGWQHLTCTAAPIRDPETHAVVGALDITGGYRLVRSHLLALIMRCALDIEEGLAPVPAGLGKGTSVPAR